MGLNCVIYNIYIPYVHYKIMFVIASVLAFLYFVVDKSIFLVKQYSMKC